MAEGAESDAVPRERPEGSRVANWLLLEADRLVVAFLLTAGVFLVFVVAVTWLPPPFEQQLRSGDLVDTMFSTMIGVVVTGTTLVVTIGQLVLTQENGPLGDQHQRMSASMDVREFTGELIGRPSPADPADFLGALVGLSAERSRALRESFDEADDAALRDAIATLTDDVAESAEAVQSQLDGARFGSFSVVGAALDFEYSRKIAAIERLAYEHDSALSEPQRDALDGLKTALSLFGPAREHVKTLYFQWALIDLSRRILYAAVPALAVAGLMLATVTLETFPGTTLGVDHIVLAVGGAFAVTLLPFLLFVAYVLRILTVAKRTLAIEPLVLRGPRE